MKPLETELDERSQGQMPTKAQREQREANRNKAMGHAVRAAAFRVLREAPASPAEVAKVIGETTQSVSFHVKQLEKLGCAELIERRIVGGNVKNIYRATEPFLIETEDWEELAPSVKEGRAREFAQAHVDDLVLWAGSHGGKDKFFHLTGNHYSLDEQGRDRIMEIVEEARLACEEENAAAAQRIADGNNSIRVATMLGVIEIPPTE
jgi:DNA-binding transcriptional ArsR family regulator